MNASRASRVLSVIGTRPEAIKMAPVALALARDGRFRSRLVVTGQHRELLDSALVPFGLVPDIDLDLMTGGQDLFDVTARTLLGMRTVLEEERPDVVVVHGDTTTCLAATLAAFYAGVPVAHVEAGLRSSDLRRPFPEEANRVLADRLASLWFAPTEGARANLVAEGVPEADVWVTGNTVVDALGFVHARVRSQGAREFTDAFGGALAARLERRPERLVLLTVHRRESFGRPLASLLEAVREVAERHPGWLFVWPVHPNPNVRGPAEALLEGVPNVVRTAPLAYAPLVWLLDRADLVLTDSGGLQEEGAALGKRVLVLREVTERPEALGAGGRLVGTDPARIRAALEEELAGERRPARGPRACPFGDGHAAERIVRAIAERFAHPREAAVA